MAITRTPIVDDDGTGTTGTVIDNAWKQQFYDQIDGAVGAVFAAPAGWALSWVLVGGSGLSLGNGTISVNYIKEGRRVVFAFVIIGGTTTNWGTGGAFYTFSLPVPCMDPYAVNCAASIWNVNAGAVRPALGLGVDANTINLIDMQGAPVHSTNPSAWWGNLARIEVTGTYFSAS